MIDREQDRYNFLLQRMELSIYLSSDSPHHLTLDHFLVLPAAPHHSARLQITFHLFYDSPPLPIPTQRFLLLSTIIIPLHTAPCYSSFLHRFLALPMHPHSFHRNLPFLATFHRFLSLPTASYHSPPLPICQEWLPICQVEWLSILLKMI